MGAELGIHHEQVTSGEKHRNMVSGASEAEQIKDKGSCVCVVSEMVRNCRKK